MHRRHALLVHLPKIQIEIVAEPKQLQVPLVRRPVQDPTAVRVGGEHTGSKSQQQQERKHLLVLHSKEQRKSTQAVLGVHAGFGLVQEPDGRAMPTQGGPHQRRLQVARRGVHLRIGLQKLRDSFCVVKQRSPMQQRVAVGIFQGDRRWFFRNQISQHLELVGSGNQENILHRSFSIQLLLSGHYRHHLRDRHGHRCVGLPVAVPVPTVPMPVTWNSSV
mmetsp:Transcript_86403/g.231415  ORF Transcript_86403/g.231415 Transcript_86403/m.231415 type:complete len:219 (+) Transcript_86403:1198-1854(+)